MKKKVQRRDKKTRKRTRKRQKKHASSGKSIKRKEKGGERERLEKGRANICKRQEKRLKKNAGES